MTKVFDALIVGGGPAGVSCATWMKQLGFEPLLIEKNEQCGGLQLSNPYTNTWIASSSGTYGADIAAAMQANMIQHNVAMRLGISAQRADVDHDGVQLALSTGETVHGKYLVLAGGVSPKTGGHSNRLGLIVGPGHGVAKTNFSGARVAILGGGDSAFENYNFISKQGPAQLSIYARTLRARSEMLEQVPPEHVVVGDYALDTKNNTVNGQPFDQIVVLYGYEANKESLLGLELLMKSDGFVWTNGDCATNNDRVYAIGELAHRAHPCCVTSMADGVVTAKALQRRLESTKLAQFAGMARRTMTLGSKVLT